VIRCVAMAGRAGEVAVVVCAVAILGRSWLRVASASDAVVDLQPREVALGSVPEGEERVIRLIASNPAAVPLEAVVTPSCTCTSLEPGPLRIGARSRVEVPVRVSTARKPGYNVAHVQIASAAGVVLAQSEITFTAVQAFVLEPPVLFLRAGDARVVGRAFCLAQDPPDELTAAAGDPALTVTVSKTGTRAWEIAIAVTGRPRSRLATVRLIARGAAGEESAGLLTVSVPSTRIGEVRVASVAERQPDGRARAWILVDAESRCELDVRALRPRGDAPISWSVTRGATEAGSHLWIELVYGTSSGVAAIDLEVSAGSVTDRFDVTLPAMVSS
jgi:hypothetical protein